MARTRLPQIAALMVLSGILPAAVPSWAQGETESRIHGFVLLPDGKPAAGAAISSEWEVAENQLKPSHGAAFWNRDERTTTIDGEFSTVLHDAPPPILPLMVIDYKRRLGVLRFVTRDELDRPIRLQLAPLIDMKIRFDRRDVFVPRQTPPPTTAPTYDFGVYLNATPTDGRSLLIARASGESPGLDLPLPKGKYELYFYGENVIMESTQFELRDKPVDVGKIRPKMEILAKYIGKPPPEWNITEARGISKDTKLADLRGKVVVVEFWGVGCGICVAGSLPELKKYVREHPAAREKLVVLAFHDPSIGSLEGLDNYLPKLEEKYWNKEPLPFPILLDATGTTIDRWGIFGYPSNVVIDTEGRVVQLSHDPYHLAAALDYLLRPETPAPGSRPHDGK